MSRSVRYPTAMKHLCIFLLMWEAVITSSRVMSQTEMSDKDMDTMIHNAITSARDTMEDIPPAVEAFATETEETDNGTLTSGEQLLLFGFEDDQSREIANMAAINLAVTAAIVRVSNMSLPVIREDRRVIRMFKKMMDDTCFQQEFSCSLLYPYRTADGSCNNIDNPSWGKSFTPELRFLPPQYDDGIGAPRRTAKNGLPLPSAREVTNAVFRDNTSPKSSPDKTVMVMAWGQFIDHDFTRTPISSGPGGKELDCCGPDSESIPDCFPIEIPTDDAHFNKTCMQFSRSTASVSLDCIPDQREQLNSLTSYIDASNVYGSTQDEQDSLRLKRDGELLMHGNGLPRRPKGCITDGSPKDYCFHAGDARVNTVPSLGATHTVFLREHNRIAKELGKINVKWTDEIIFQETRKIISAFNQQITYGEFLPVLLNDKLMTRYGLYNSAGHSDVYDETVNAATSNAFAAATFRFGHTLVPHYQGLMHTDLNTIDQFRTETTFNRPFLVQTESGKNQQGMCRWMCTDASGRMDRIFEKALLDLLFVDTNGDSFDLPALNIQRGRDHGIPGYNAWREWCDLPRATHFNTTVGGLVDHSPDNAKRLANVYQDVDDIDLYPGAVTEKHIPGGGIGPTFACMMARQLKNFKTGDRYWYERPPLHHGGTGFTQDQLLEVKKMTLAKLMCKSQALEDIQPNVFRKPGFGNSNYFVKCDSLPDMDLTKWSVTHKEDNFCNV